MFRVPLNRGPVHLKEYGDMDIGAMSPISVKNCTLDSYLENSNNQEIVSFLSEISNFVDPWDKIPQSRGYKPDILVDVKFHDLQASETPALPGWHVDGSTLIAPKPNKRKEKYLLYICGTVSPTEFCLDQISVDPGPMGMKQVDSHMASPHRCLKLRSGFYITYDSLQMHRATPAKESGKRLLIRLMASDTILGLPYERAIVKPTIR